MIRKELDHEDGELTATQKVKRAAIAEMFGSADRRTCTRAPGTGGDAG